MVKAFYMNFNAVFKARVNNIFEPDYFIAKYQYCLRPGLQVVHAGVFLPPILMVLRRERSCLRDCTDHGILLNKRLYYGIVGND